MRTNRRWLLTAATITLGLFFRRNAKASIEGKKCILNLFNQSKAPVSNYIVSLRSKAGAIVIGSTDERGAFEFQAPEDSSYAIQVREPILRTVVTSITQLTAGKFQDLSVTVPSEQSYLGVYNALQAIELIFVVGDGVEGSLGVDNKTLSASVSTETTSKQLLDNLERLMEIIGKFKSDTVATNLLRSKAESLINLTKELRF